MSAIERQHEYNDNYNADVAANLTSIVEINVRGIAGLRVYNKSGGSVTLTFYDAPWHTCEKRGGSAAANQYNAGTFLQCYDQATGAALSITVPNNTSMDVPPAVFAAGALKIVCAAGAATIGYSAKG